VSRSAAETPLLERERELAELASLVAAAAAGDGRVAIVGGPAGIGKTRLLHAALELASAAGVRPLHARASELERGFPFGVVRQLLEAEVLASAPAERDELLAGAARHAAPVLDVAAQPEGDRWAAVRGLYGRQRPAALPADRPRRRRLELRAVAEARPQHVARPLSAFAGATLPSSVRAVLARGQISRLTSIDPPLYARRRGITRRAP
jgi:hypothetical protein